MSYCGVSILDKLTSIAYFNVRNLDQLELIFLLLIPAYNPHISCWMVSEALTMMFLEQQDLEGYISSCSYLHIKFCTNIIDISRSETGKLFSGLGMRPVVKESTWNRHWEKGENWGPPLPQQHTASVGGVQRITNNLSATNSDASLNHLFGCFEVESLEAATSNSPAYNTQILIVKEHEVECTLTVVNLKKSWKTSLEGYLRSRATPLMGLRSLPRFSATL